MPDEPKKNTLLLYQIMLFTRFKKGICVATLRQMPNYFHVKKKLFSRK